LKNFYLVDIVPVSKTDCFSQPLPAPTFDHWRAQFTPDCEVLSAFEF